MCLAVIALGAHPRYPLVIAANRDEFHARPTAAAHWWDEGWLAGRDLQAGGTWLGVTRSGRVALLTNVRDPARHDPNAPSRGTLVTRVLADPAPPAEALAAALADASEHNGFNLVVATPREAHWGWNRGGAPRALEPGIHGLSNASLDMPWPKVVRTTAAIGAWCERADGDTERVLSLLADRTLAADDALPATGVTLEWERLLSAPFIVSERYGTRSSTVLTVDHDGRARFVERSFDASGEPLGDVVETFELGALGDAAGRTPPAVYA
jgi:uncharacterized protein with NRDE domain